MWIAVPVICATQKYDRRYKCNCDVRKKRLFHYTADSWQNSFSLTSRELDRIMLCVKVFLIFLCVYYWAACAAQYKFGFRSSVKKNGLPGEGRHEALVPRNDVLTNGFIGFSLARTLARILFVPRLRPPPPKTQKTLRTWRRLFALFEAIRP